MGKRSLVGAMTLVLVGFCFLISLKTFAESPKILAKVGDKVITQADLEEVMKRYEGLRKGKPFSLEDKKQLLNKIIQTTLICVEAEREKLNEKPELDAKVKLYRDDLLRAEYISQKIEPLVTVKEEEVEQIWKANPNLVPKESLILKEIVVNTEKEAEEIYQELKKGADFSKVATERSISPSKTRGGLIGNISRGQFPPPLEAIVFKLKEREFSSPSKTEGGFGIFYCESRKDLPAEQVKHLEERIRMKIFQLEKQKRIEAMIEKKTEELKKQTKVETYFDQLK